MFCSFGTVCTCSEVQDPAFFCWAQTCHRCSTWTRSPWCCGLCFHLCCPPALWAASHQVSVFPCFPYPGTVQCDALPGPGGGWICCPQLGGPTHGLCLLLFTSATAALHNRLRSGAGQNVLFRKPNQTLSSKYNQEVNPLGKTQTVQIRGGGGSRRDCCWAQAARPGAAQAAAGARSGVVRGGGWQRGWQGGEREGDKVGKTTKRSGM